MLKLQGIALSGPASQLVRGLARMQVHHTKATLGEGDRRVAAALSEPVRLKLEGPRGVRLARIFSAPQRATFGSALRDLVGYLCADDKALAEGLAVALGAPTVLAELFPALDRSAEAQGDLAAFRTGLVSDPMRTINKWKILDLMLGIGESTETHPDFYQLLEDFLPDWLCNMRDAAAKGYRPLIPVAYSGLLKRVRSDARLQQEGVWQESLPDLWLYWCSCRAWSNPNSVNLDIIVQTLMMIRRAICFVPEDQTGKLVDYEDQVRSRVEDLNCSASEIRKGLLSIWERIFKATKRTDLLAPKSAEAIAFVQQKSPSLLSMPGDFLQRVLQADPLPDWAHLESDLAQCVDQLWQRFRNTEHWPLFTDLLTNNMPIRERLVALRALAAEQSVSSQAIGVAEKSPAVMPRARPIIWNPLFFSQEGLVIHAGYGEGRVEDSEGPLVKVSFPPGTTNTRNIMQVSPHELVYADKDIAGFRQVAAERMERFQDLSLYYAVRALRIFLPKDEAGVSDYWKSQSYGNIAILSYLKGMRTFRSETPRDYDYARPDHIQRMLFNLALKLGIDPIAFAMRMSVGVPPHHLVFGPNGRVNVYDRILISRRITTDLIRSFVEARPWNQGWPQLPSGHVSKLLAAGHYYPDYYQGEKPNDLKDLYFAFREGSADSVREVYHQVKPLFERLVGQPGWNDALLIPVPGKAPNDQITTLIANQLGLETLDPWTPRPPEYGEGVEKQPAPMGKWEHLCRYDRIHGSSRASLQGRRVILFDDNLTDGATYMHKYRLLHDAGIGDIALVSLTRTIRFPRDFGWRFA
jgi:hypothetical protein